MKIWKIHKGVRRSKLFLLISFSRQPDGKTKISDKIVNIESAMLLALAAASPYSAAAAYAQGAYCTKDGKLYRCTVAIPQAEAWNAAHWTARGSRRRRVVISGSPSRAY